MVFGFSVKSKIHPKGYNGNVISGLVNSVNSRILNMDCKKKQIQFKIKTQGLFADAFQFYVGHWRHNQREFFYDNRASIEAKTAFF